MRFPAIKRPKIHKFTPWCPPWRHLMEILNQVNTKESESMGVGGGGYSVVDESAQIKGWLQVIADNVNI